MNSGSRSSFDGIAIVLLLFFVLFVVLVGGGATLFWVRSAQAQQEALVAMERAQAAAEEAKMREVKAQQAEEAAVAALEAEMDVDADSLGDESTTVFLELTADGVLRVAGEVTELSEASAALATGSNYVVRVASDCPFALVSQLLAEFSAAGLSQPPLTVMAP